MKIRLLALVALSATLSTADLSKVMEENNLEKRSEKALQNAETALNQARTAYKGGQQDKVQVALDEVRQSVELCRTSLDESGKNARRSPKYFKRAEIGLRKLIRRLDTFRLELSVDERGPVEQLVRRSHQIRDEILGWIMGKKRQ